MSCFIYYFISNLEWRKGLADPGQGSESWEEGEELPVMVGVGDAKNSPLD